MLKEIDLIEIIVRQAVNKSSDSRISRDDFLDAASRFTRYSAFTPLEADIIFHFAASKESSRLRLRDFNQLFDAKWSASEHMDIDHQPSFLHDLGKAAYSFGLGGIAGGIGATAVYPIDLVSRLWLVDVLHQLTKEPRDRSRPGCRTSAAKLWENCCTATRSIA